MSDLSAEQLCLLNNVMYSDMFVRRARQGEGDVLGEALRKYTPYGDDVGGVRISPGEWEAVKEKVLGDDALKASLSPTSTPTKTTGRPPCARVCARCRDVTRRRDDTSADWACRFGWRGRKCALRRDIIVCIAFKLTRGRMRHVAAGMANARSFQMTNGTITFNEAASAGYAAGLRSEWAAPTVDPVSDDNTPVEGDIASTCSSLLALGVGCMGLLNEDSDCLTGAGLALQRADSDSAGGM